MANLVLLTLVHLGIRLAVVFKARVPTYTRNFMLASFHSFTHSFIYKTQRGNHEKPTKISRSPTFHQRAISASLEQDGLVAWALAVAKGADCLCGFVVEA